MYLGLRHVSSPLHAPVLCLVSSSVPIPVRVRIRVRRRGGGSWARKLKTSRRVKTRLESSRLIFRDLRHVLTRPKSLDFV